MMAEEPVPQWDAAALSFEYQFRQLERADTTAQSLITTLTLSAALAGPLLTASGFSEVGAWFGLPLLVWLAVTGMALKHAFSVVYSAKGHRPPGDGWLHYSHIARFEDPDAFVAYLTDRPHMQQRDDLLAVMWVLATVVTEKADAVGRCIRWTGASMALLGGLIVLRLGLEVVG